MNPVLDGRAWVGLINCHGRRLVAELCESVRHPGYYHYATAPAGQFAHEKSGGSVDESIRPIKADFLQENLWLVLGLPAPSSAEWTEATWQALPFAPLRGEGQR